MKTITVKVDIEVPKDATHFIGDLTEIQSVDFFKMKNIGVVGEHWFIYSGDSNTDWKFYGHEAPRYNLRKFSDIII